METSENGIALIKKYEGLYLYAYQCPANIWTIGHGHTLNVLPGDKITQCEADRLLRFDILSYEKIVVRHVKVPLTQGQFDALVSFVFNLGEGNFRRSTLLYKLNSGDYKGAANEFCRWVNVCGNVALGLVRRRQAERKLFLKA